jgi:deazaflavin-dependent oxidoreductase (nitroreductase family)
LDKDSGGVMPINQAVLDRIRVINKHFTNKILIHISGKRFGHFAILEHTGRKSGKNYRIPVIAEPIDNGFVVALTYGKNVDWYKNVAAQGGCRLVWKKKEYRLVQPEWVEVERGLAAYPKVFQKGLRRAGIQFFLKLEIEQSSTGG